MAFKFKIKLAVLTRLISMSVITVFAAAVMIAINIKGQPIEQREDTESAGKPAKVSVLQVAPLQVKIKKKYSGIVRPFERYSLSFKSAGRVDRFALNSQGRELDEGDAITSDMELAWLDTKLLEAQRAEQKVTLDFAKKEYDDVAQDIGAVSQTEINRRKSAWEVAEAKLKIIDTQIDDGVLRSKVNGVISQRMINPGESVAQGQTVFEVIQVDQVKLVVGIPESKIRRLVNDSDPQQSLLAFVKLIGENNRKPPIPSAHLLASTFAKSTVQKFGRNFSAGSAQVEDDDPNGFVHLVSQASDDKSGMFEVEILLDNELGIYRPGMIAIAEIVIAEIEGCRIPIDAVFFREDETFVFVVGESEQNGEKVQVAKKYLLEQSQYETQGKYLIVKGMPADQRNIIVGGHRRLVEGRQIELVKTGNRLQSSIVETSTK